MPRRNKYTNRSRISEAKFRSMIKHFSLDLDAQRISVLVRLNRNTVNRYLRLIRERIAQYCEKESPLQDEIEVDESYFGAKRIKGKRGLGAGGKTPVFGILERAFRELRRRTRPMNLFPNADSANRIFYGVTKNLNQSWNKEPLKNFPQSG